MFGCLWSGLSGRSNEPNAGQWKTWVIPSGSTYRLPAPPDAVATAGELQWVKDRAANRNPSDLAQIHYWDAGSPGYRWMQLTEQLAVSQGLAGPLQTRALALVAAAIYDSTVAAWDSEVRIQAPASRRIGSGREAGGNSGGPPSYPSEHAAAAGAAAAVLAYLFPEQAASVMDMGDQAGMSRFMAAPLFRATSSPAKTWVTTWARP